MMNMCVWWSVALLLIDIKSTFGFVQPTSFIINNSYQKERTTTLSSLYNNDEYSNKFVLYGDMLIFVPVRCGLFTTSSHIGVISIG